MFNGFSDSFQCQKCAKVQFWAFGSPKAEKRRGAIMAPPDLNVFPEAGSDRVKTIRWSLPNNPAHNKIFWSFSRLLAFFYYMKTSSLDTAIQSLHVLQGDKSRQLIVSGAFQAIFSCLYSQTSKISLLLQTKVFLNLSWYYFLPIFFIIVQFQYLGKNTALAPLLVALNLLSILSTGRKPSMKIRIA